MSASKGKGSVQVVAWNECSILMEITHSPADQPMSSFEATAGGSLSRGEKKQSAVHYFFSLSQQRVEHS